MFRASETEPQMSLFDNPSDMMCKRAAKKYEDPKAWQNQFYRMVTSEIDESLFQPLFKEGRMGAPNASIRRLVALSRFLDRVGIFFSALEIWFQLRAIRPARITCSQKGIFLRGLKKAICNGQNICKFESHRL